ncbi:MAG: ABC transporter permease [Oscillospiraceae bacterium]|nr:ABC transporter permease [Oscillospiraceae bacterium]
MKNIFPLTLANLRRGKSQAVSLFAFVLLAALLLNMGLLLMLNYGSFFAKHAEELSTPHHLVLEEKRLYSPAQADYLRSYPGVLSVESEPVIGLPTEIAYGGGMSTAIMFFSDTGSQRTMNGFSIFEGQAPEAVDEICLPYMFNPGGGYRIGDSFTVSADGASYTFTISGFTEEILCGSPNNQMYQAYLSPEGYRHLLSQMPHHEAMILLARLEDPENSKKLGDDFVKEFLFSSEMAESHDLFFWTMSWSAAKMTRTMMSDITSMILVLFAAMIVFISLLVMRFRIRNSIEESMSNIGALKAVGYTGRQLLHATVLQFFSIALVGTLAGIGLSYTTLPAVSDILEAQTALRWQQGFDMASSLISFALILVAVLAVTYFCARRIQKMQPLEALRQGLATHSYGKNHLPLCSSRGPLSLLLAVKSALQAKGQMLMIFLIVAAVSFMAAAGMSIYDNLGVHPEAFSQLLAGEVPDCAFAVRDAEDVPAIRAYFEQSREVRKVFYHRDHTVLIDDVSVLNIVVEDFGLLEGGLLYAGRYPKHGNEIVLSGSLSALSGKDIGDAVGVMQNGRTEEYLVVGKIQTVNNSGVACAMTIDGIKRAQPDYRPREMYVYMHDSAETAAFVEAVRGQWDAEMELVIDLQELMEAQLGVYGTIFQMVAAVIVVVTILVIVMVLYMMLKTVILRRRRDLGIQKALGFTTPQLMNQFALHFIPVIALGVVAGGIGGLFGFNPMFVGLTRGMGIMTASMPAPIGLTVVLCVALILVAYLFAMLIAWRIRKISAWTLVSE